MNETYYEPCTEPVLPEELREPEPMPDPAEEDTVYETEKDSMFDEVCEILALQLHLEPKDIAMESRIKDDLGADSLDILQLLMTIEEEKGIVIPDEELVGFNTVGDVVSYLERQGGKDQDAFE